MTEKTKHQVSRFLDKVADKYHWVENPVVLTDIHVRVSQDTGDLMAFDDDCKEVTRCVVDEWIDNHDNTAAFYNDVEEIIRSVIVSKNVNLGVMKPYSFILENEAGEHVAELYVVDDDETVILPASFLEDMDKELDDFIEKLLSED